MTRLMEELAAPSVEGIMLWCCGCRSRSADVVPTLLDDSGLTDAASYVLLLASSACETPHPNTWMCCFALCIACLRDRTTADVPVLLELRTRRLRSRKLNRCFLRACSRGEPSGTRRTSSAASCERVRTEFRGVDMTRIRGRRWCGQPFQCTLILGIM